MKKSVLNHFMQNKIEKKNYLIWDVVFLSINVWDCYTPTCVFKDLTVSP